MKISVAILLGLALVGSTQFASAQQGPGRGRGPGGPGGVGPQQFPPPLAAMDANADGALDQPEVTAGMLVFVDANNDGKLTADELCIGECPNAEQKPAFQGQGQRRGPGQGRGAGMGAPKGPGKGMGQVPVLLRLLDADKDGAVSPQEAANAWAVLAQLDANKDGFITPNELRPMGGQGRGPHGGGPRGAGNGGVCPLEQ